MGVFQEVVACCPKCEAYTIRYQPNTFIEEEYEAATWYADEGIPVRVAEELDGKLVWCGHCEREYTILIPRQTNKVRMVVAR